MVRIDLVERDVVTDVEQLPLSVVQQPEVHPVHLLLGERREREELAAELAAAELGALQRLGEPVNGRVELGGQLGAIAALARPGLELGAEPPGDLGELVETHLRGELERAGGRFVVERDVQRRRDNRVGGAPRPSRSVDSSSSATSPR